VNQKVLFVDDEPGALDGYRRTLQGEFDIATAATGEAGLVSLHNHGPFAIVVSGIPMASPRQPGMVEKNSAKHVSWKRCTRVRNWRLRAYCVTWRTQRNSSG
jgi:DNA-binding NtrC family response regulator